MALKISRRDALRAAGASALLGVARPGVTAARSKPWLATAEQERAEKIVLELIADPEVKRLQSDILAQLASTPRALTLPDAASTLARAVAQWTNSLIFAEIIKDPSHPVVLWGTDDTPRDWLSHHLGGVGMSGDNPDDIYRAAGFEGGGRYEIIGQFHHDSRPTQVLLELSAIDIAKPTTMMTPTARGRSPDPQPMAQLNQDQLIVDSSGRFRITIGPRSDRSWSSANHLTLPQSDFSVLAVRDVLSNWNQRATRLFVRRIDKVNHVPWSAQNVRELVMRDLRDYISFWANFPNIWFGGLKPNTHSAPQARPGGWGYVAGVNFHLADGEAILITLDPSGALYTGFQINDPWMIAPDARSAQVCLNISQVEPNADGTVTYIISKDDPGAANWLDTTGYNDGFGIMRWQAVRPGLTEDQLIRDFRLLRWSELEQLTGIPRVTASERRRRIALRKIQYETRVR